MERVIPNLALLPSAIESQASRFDNPKTLGLRFDSPDDAVNFAAHSVSTSKDWLAFDPLNFVRGYKNGELEIVVEAFVGGSVGAESEQFHLIFRAVPLVMQRHLKESCATYGDAGWHKYIEQGHDDLMLVRVASLVYCEEQVIPSEVRLEPAKERLDFARKISASAYSVNHVIERTSEGERAVFRVGFPDACGNGVSSIVESSPKVLHEFTEHIAHIVKFGTKFPCWFDFMNFMAGLIRVRFDNFVVWAAVSECFDLLPKIGKVFFTPF